MGVIPASEKEGQGCDTVWDWEGSDRVSSGRLWRSCHSRLSKPTIGCVSSTPRPVHTTIRLFYVLLCQ